MIKEVIFFTPGDVKDPSLWSNVPYLYCKELELRGILVHKINILPYNIISRVFTYISYVIYNIFNIDYRRAFAQSNIARVLAMPIIRRSIKKYNSADCCIFMGAGYANYWSDMPTIIFAESSLEKVIRVRCNREPYVFERPLIKQHQKAFERASFISILFSRDLDYIKKTIPSANIKYKGSSVINTFYEGEIDESVIAKKSKSKKILFIGGSHYLEGANMLVRAFELLRKQDPEYELDIIALEESQLDKVVEGVYCHGYLNKENPYDQKMYYDLMFNAKVFVNPTPFWGSYSSCIEAMYYYTPCVVHPYDQFVLEFGNQLSFGEYNEKFTPEGVAASLQRVLQNPNYYQMSKCAHDRVKDYTYEAYVNWTFEELIRTKSYKRWKAIKN